MAIRIDKSAFTPEERATYEALIAKASVETDPQETPVDKSASPELTAALEKVATLEKSIAMKDCTDVAKKYADTIGEKVEDLAKTLYDMKALGEEPYNKYVSALEKSAQLVEKSGVFTEIGKSTSAVGGSVIDKIEAAASELQKSDASMSRDVALAKAWQNNPELIAEYDAEYNK